ncbi:MAG: hypothetical protein JW779_02720 [Candidatus Thorarchaeota archaeon]|nr:hypothetical protein [Candidatus Thorarchaeota archaeon]
MAQMSTVLSAIRRKSTDDAPADIVGVFAGFGSILSIIAAAIGLLAGVPLIPITSTTWEVVVDTPIQWSIAGNPQYHLFSGAFMGLLAIGLILQAFGSRDLRAKLGTIFGSVLYVAFLVAAVIAVYVLIGYFNINYASEIGGFLANLYLLGSIFVLTWQMVSVLYVDSSKTWIGFFAGILNGLFIPILALGQVLGPLLVYGAYAILLGGQLCALLFWWSPNSTIREYARSPEKAKFAFGLGGLLTFAIGTAAVFIGPITTHPTGSTIWRPWITLAPSGTEYVTNPALIFGFLAAMVFWILLSPRLGAKELKTAAIGEDIIKGGSKWFAVFLLLIGLLAASQSGTFSTAIGSWGFFLVIAPAGAMILIGALYTAKTDIVTGFPLIITAVLIMINPHSLAIFVIAGWMLILITQVFLTIECKIRGLTGFSQGAVTVLMSILTSIVLIVVMFGWLGSGPQALWPTNRWFNIALIPGVDRAVQSAFIIIMPFLALLLRNAALAGFAHGRGYSTGGILMGITVIFALMIPAIAGNFTVTHEANTGAALLLALYAMSLVMVVSLNLKLANDVEEQGHDFESTLMKVASIGQIIFSAAVLLIVLVYFSGLPTPEEIAFVISMLVVFVASSEVLSIIGWLIAGIRLGLLKEGFRFTRLGQ